MKLTIPAFFAAIASFAILPPGPALAQTDLSGSIWLAEDIMGAGTIDRAQSTLQAQPDGRVAGSGGCNRFFGKGLVSDGKVAIGQLATTRMACPKAVMDQEARYLKALAAATTYKVGREGLLQFFDASGTPVIRFSRMK